MQKLAIELKTMAIKILFMTGLLLRIDTVPIILAQVDFTTVEGVIARVITPQ
jgi:hypothetical protein